MKPAIPGFLFLAFLLIGAVARGQTSPCPDHPLFGTLAYKTLEGPQAIAVGDLNGDGVTDLVVGTTLIPFSSTPGHSVSIMLGTGDGRMGPATDLPFTDTIESVALGDLDGDGDLDPVTGARNDAATPIPVVPGPTGFMLSAALDPGLVGQSILVQAVTLSPLPTSFYGFALSPAHLITFAP